MCGLEFLGGGGDIVPERVIHNFFYTTATKAKAWVLGNIKIKLKYWNILSLLLGGYCLLGEIVLAF